MAKYREENAGDPTPQFEQMLKTALDSELLHTWTALPGIVKAFDSEKQTAEIRAALLQEYTTEEGFIRTREHPLLINVPVHFVRGGGFVVTHPLIAGDSGLIVFSSRCIDSWAQTGGIQPQAIRRKHSFSDGIFIPGVSSIVDAISGFNTTALEIRNLSGSTSIKIEGNDITLTAPGRVEITSPELTHNGVNIGATHHHFYIRDISQFTSPNPGQQTSPPQ